MASVRECERALYELAVRLSDVDSDRRRRYALDRTLSCRLEDIGAAYSGRIENGALRGLLAEADPNAQIKLTLSSDDLLALTEGRLSLATAWAAGRVRVDASVFDLLKLRSLI